jgi:hypothetical protein
MVFIRIQYDCQLLILLYTNTGFNSNLQYHTCQRHDSIRVLLHKGIYNNLNLLLKNMHVLDRVRTNMNHFSAKQKTLVNSPS